MQIQEITKKWRKHIVAILLFAALSAIYFAPAVFDGKVIRQGDMDRYVGMVGGNQMDQYAKPPSPASSAHGRMQCLGECRTPPATETLHRHYPPSKSLKRHSFHGALSMQVSYWWP